MRHLIDTRQVSEADVKRWKSQIYAINESVTPAAKAFSDALGEGSRFILKLLIFINLTTALGLIILALLRTHKILAQSRDFAEALQVEKERGQRNTPSLL